MAAVREFSPGVDTRMPTIDIDRETIERLDSLRLEDESYDEIITELVDIYGAEELTLFHGGDRI